MARRLTKDARAHLLNLACAVVAKNAPTPNGTLSGDGWRGEFAGMCPVQGEGEVDGRPFYFRARGEHWELSVAHAGGDPVEVSIGCADGFSYSEPYGTWPEAGWMSEPHVMRAMTKAVGIFRASLTSAVA